MAASRLAAQAPPPQRAWLSAGVGAATWPYGSLAAVLSGWYSAGSVALGVRTGAAGEWIGEQRNDRSVLLGGRTRGNRRFLLGSVGIGRVASYRTCDGPCSEFHRPTATAMTYGVEAHVDYKYAGAGLVMFGAFGPPSDRYNAFALTLDAGWFGH